MRECAPLVARIIALWLDFLPPVRYARRMTASARTTLVAAAYCLGLLAGVAQARDQTYRGLLVDHSGAQSRFRFTVRSCSTDSEGTSQCQGRFSRCRTDPCPATRGQTDLVFGADGSVSLALVSEGQRLACELVSDPGPERGTYICR